jgi:hypothetical protein
MPAMRGRMHHAAPFDCALPNDGNTPLRVLASSDENDRVSLPVEATAVTSWPLAEDIVPRIRPSPAPRGIITDCR